MCSKCTRLMHFTTEIYLKSKALLVSPRGYIVDNNPQYEKCDGYDYRYVCSILHTYLFSDPLMQTEISRQLWIAIKLMFPGGWFLLTLDIPWLFFKHLCLEWNYSSIESIGMKCVQPPRYKLLSVGNPCDVAFSPIFTSKCVLTVDLMFSLGALLYDFNRHLQELFKQIFTRGCKHTFLCQLVGGFFISCSCVPKAILSYRGFWGFPDFILNVMGTHWMSFGLMKPSSELIRFDGKKKTTKERKWKKRKNDEMPSTSAVIWVVNCEVQRG